MTVSYRTGITILQFIFFVPTFFYSLYLCFNKGLKTAGTWRFIATLSALRIAGDISYFVALGYPTINAYVSVIICELMGLAPLMLTLVALVGRVNITTKTYPQMSILLITSMSVVGLLLGVIGAEIALKKAATIDDVHVNGLMKASLALFLTAFSFMLIGYSAVLVDVHRHPEKRVALGRKKLVLVAVAAAAPFVAIRLVYACLGDYTSMTRFSVIYGDDTVYLVMGILMEIFAIVICLACAPLLPPPEKKESVKETSQKELAATA